MSRDCVPCPLCGGDLYVTHSNSMVLSADGESYIRVSPIKCDECKTHGKVVVQTSVQMHPNVQ